MTVRKIVEKVLVEHPLGGSGENRKAEALHEMDRGAE